MAIVHILAPFSFELPDYRMRRGCEPFDFLRHSTMNAVASFTGGVRTDFPTKAALVTSQLELHQEDVNQSLRIEMPYFHVVWLTEFLLRGFIMRGQKQ